ncbi:MAG: CMGC CDK kinase [Lasallia pustulata]|uniref:Serine/threonine-protein kinase BUR1 n=1 Tax=Lasallia pustulata TaxID=136370 RepID=A0A5M8PUL5_9LECA|nr:MAG: CMGC CDK kinase [Lasallia pustulata]
MGTPLHDGVNAGSENMKQSLERHDEVRPPRFRGCSSIKAYEFLGKLGEGTFGEVHKARSVKCGSVVALKKILMHNEKDGFPITALREIKLLKMLSHPNILRLKEMAVERAKEGRRKAVMYMVTPYMDHDLSGLLENPAVNFTEPQIKCYMLQLLKGVEYLHANKVLHRDMKAANLLINNRGILQIADFGLARPYDDPPPQRGKGGGEATRDYTTLVVTRWYRPPELLLQLRRYTTAIDMWGVGCVFGEMFKGRPILAGNSDLNQAQMIFDLVGSPTEENMPGWSSLPGCEGVQSFKTRPPTLPQFFREQGSSAISLLSELLKLDWRKRINAIDALEHPYFKNSPLPAKPGEIPEFEDSHELDRRKFRGQRAALPPAPAGGTVGMGPNGEWANGSSTANHQGPRRPLGGAGSFQKGLLSHGPSRNGYEDRILYSQQQHNHRAPGPSAPLPPGHRPPWGRDGHALPPRPPPSNVGWPGQGWAGDGPADSRAPPRVGLGSGGSRADTYIPSYAHGADGPRGRDDAMRRDDGPRRDERGGPGRYGDRRDYEARAAGRRRSRSPDPHRDNERMRDSNREVYRR